MKSRTEAEPLASRLGCILNPELNLLNARTADRRFARSWGRAEVEATQSKGLASVLYDIFSTRRSTHKSVALLSTGFFPDRLLRAWLDFSVEALALLKLPSASVGTVG